MNHLIYALTAPADKTVFDRISSARTNFLAWSESLREKKIDVEHMVATYRQLQHAEDRLEQVHALGAEPSDRLYHELRAKRIYFRVLLLDLLNQEDAWLASEDAKRKTR
ncbi:hypothetical protein KIKIMORA_02830 [Brevundimonas phage vB_BpoS-Kikimora]|uniref:Uncharacterized protein n=1 Tax=Brevundimonas phage vB_BpoS-Kikimora TaxID=2948601 RepID=A0A9E7SLD5_9CAUD|nr:hypothetical protein KIKIMORA_02830 [Brevundimonas phage vB_BpoS-Kikimora]